MEKVNPISRSEYKEELQNYSQLLGAASSVSHAAGGIQTSTRYIRSTQIFTRMMVIVYTFFRLLPGNPITRDEVEHWDWPTIASVARNFVEAYLNFFYLGVDDISEEEVDFRIKSMWLHLNSEKYLLCKSGPREVDLREFEKNLPIQKQEIREHPFFKRLTIEQQKRVLSGKYPTYMTLSELIRRIPFQTEELSWMYRQYSNETHSTAFAFHSQSNERGRGDDNPAERSYIVFASWLVRKYLSASVVAMAKIFPKEIGNAEKMAVDLAEDQLARFLNENKNA